MHKKIPLKITLYVLSTCLLAVTVIHHIYRLNGNEFLLRPSYVALMYSIYYLFIDHKIRDQNERHHVRKLFSLTIFLYAAFELIVLLVG